MMAPRQQPQHSLPAAPQVLLWDLMRGFRGKYAWAIACLFFFTFINYLTPLVASAAIDYALAEKPNKDVLTSLLIRLMGGGDFVKENLWFPALLMVSLTVASGFFSYGKDRLAAEASDGVARKLKDRLYDHLQRLPVRFHDRAETGDLIQRCTSDVETLRLALSTQVVAVSNSMLLLLTALPIMVILDQRMALASFSLIGPIIFFGYFYFKKVKAPLSRSGRSGRRGDPDRPGKPHRIESGPRLRQSGFRSGQICPQQPRVPRPETPPHRSHGLVLVRLRSHRPSTTGPRPLFRHLLHRRRIPHRGNPFRFPHVFEHAPLAGSTDGPHLDRSGEITGCPDPDRRNSSRTGGDSPGEPGDSRFAGLGRNHRERPRLWIRRGGRRPQRHFVPGRSRRNSRHRRSIRFREVDHYESSSEILRLSRWLDSDRSTGIERPRPPVGSIPVRHRDAGTLSLFQDHRGKYPLEPVGSGG